MDQVTISGWTEGLNKVQLNHLLRRSGGCGLREAKDAVDKVLRGESVVVDVADGLSFCESASELGAICSLSPMREQVSAPAASR